MYERGSEWRRWDLHVHSPLSILNNQFPMLQSGEPDWEKYVGRLEELDLAALAITDYFTIEGYKKILEYRKQGRLPKVDLVLPNIEFRLNVFVGKDAKRVNFHVIFSDEVSVGDIEDHFLSELKFVYEKDPYGPQLSKSLKRANLEALGAKLRAEQPDLPGATDLTIGANQAAISLDAIIECLQRQPDRFDGKFILVLADESMSKMAWQGQDHATRKSLLQACQVVFTSNIKAREFLLGKVSTYADGPDKFVAEFGSLKPAVWGSDAHSLLELGNPCAKRGDSDHTCTMKQEECDPRFTWVKADPTFEGLKQLLCEPEDRVIVGAQSPLESKSTFTLKEFRIEGATISPSLAMKGVSIPLNSGLVVITGGKGSGKTALAELLANCFASRTSSPDTNSFVRRIASSKPTFRTGFTTIGGETFEKQVLEPKAFEKSEVVYIPQGQLDVKISEGSDFSRYVHSLVFENERVRNTKQVFEFGELEKEALRLKVGILKSARRISELETQTKESVFTQVQKDIALSASTVEDINKRIAEVASTDGKGLEALLKADEAINKAIDEMKELRTDAETVRSLTAEVIEFVKDDVPKVNSTISRINDLVVKRGLGVQLSTVGAPATATLNELDLKVKSALSDIVTKIETEQKKLSGHSDIRRRHAQLLASKSDAAKKLALLSQEKVSLDTKIEDLKKEKQEAREAYRSLLKEKLAIRLLYQQIIKSFLENREAILKDLSFRVHARFSRQAFESRAEELFDNRVVLVRGVDGRSGDFDGLLDALDAAVSFDGSIDLPEFSAAMASVDKQLDAAAGLRSKLKSSFLDDSTTFYELLLGDHFTVEPVVEYKGAEVSKLSLGQKATVLVKIHLAQGDRPIIIDSHDDHLDNEFIMDELIDALRSAKRHRQIILASNNGNVVVNSDADQVILSRIDNQTISYSAGSLENPAVRARALTVLEGGEAAFKRRQDKYRLGRIH